ARLGGIGATERMAGWSPAAAVVGNAASAGTALTTLARFSASAPAGNDEATTSCLAALATPSVGAAGTGNADATADGGSGVLLPSIAAAGDSGRGFDLSPLSPTG
ncbi:MAG: hypothetical protein JW751_13265, partial [Polyangiaceae bacterium]|nr:hypothetical protein [Polyangiaceae bacterium]